jgi:hypothetical protein
MSIDWWAVHDHSREWVYLGKEGEWHFEFYKFYFALRLKKGTWKFVSDEEINEYTSQGYTEFDFELYKDEETLFYLACDIQNDLDKVMSEAWMQREIDGRNVNEG